jgi:hypothetical protein
MWIRAPFLISLDDRTLNPAMVRFNANHRKSNTTEIKSSHVTFISHPDAVVRMIEEGATAR